MSGADAQRRSEPPWVEHVVWWQLQPLGFLGAEKSALPPDSPVQHRLPAITAWLDYLVELGASGLMLGPLLSSETHGYDTVDYLQVDRRLGDDADLAALVDEAHRRGIRVMLDGVFNHVGRGFPLFQQALREGRGSEAARWFHLFWPESGQGEPDYEHFEGHRSLPTLDHTNPAVADLVVEVMCHWLDRGVDAWRLDAAYAVPAGFWAEVLPRVRERHPDVYVMGEVIHGDYSGYVADSGIDSLTQYELWKAIWGSLNDRNLYELDWNLTRHNGFLETFVPLTFVGNHDVTRIASKLDDERHLPHALVVLLTVGGTPSLYAGDEQGFRGVKEEREGGDDAVRPAFPDSPSDLSPVGAHVRDLHQHLVGVRRRNPWLHRARTSIEHLANEQVVFTARDGGSGSGSGSGAALVVALNISDDHVTLPAPGAVSVTAGVGHLDTGQATIALAPHGWAVLTT